MKKYLAFFLAVVMTFSFAGCGGKDGGSGENPIDAAKTAFVGFMDSLKALDMQNAGKFLDAGELSSAQGEGANSDDAAITAAFSGISYNVVSVTEVSSEQVEIVADISTTDLMGVFGQCTMNVMNEYMEDKITDEQIDSRVDEIFREEIAKDDLPVAANQVTVNVKKTDGGWKVELSQELQNAILGGFPAQFEASRPQNAN